MSSPGGSRGLPRQSAAENFGMGRQGTRVGVPRMPPGIIERNRLTQRLASHAPLTVLRAPSGFGKTVAVTQWLNSPAGPEGPAVWVRGDPSLDATSFWAELAGLLMEAGIRVPSVGGLMYRAIETSVRRLAEPLTIVVDGFDDLSDPQIEDHLLDLARYCQNLRLIVCLRSSRHFPGSLRVDIVTTLIESRELAFTVEEIAAVSPPVPHLSTAWAAEVHRCTAGWPEPTRAVLLALQDDSWQAVDDAALSVARDYLAKRILPHLHQAAWLDFALMISIPEKLTEDVAREITGDAYIRRRLERLETAGVVTVKDHRGRRIYRWPDAVKNALQEEFARRNPDKLSALHHRLARWYLHDGDGRSAARHALSAGDTALLVRIVERFWSTLLHQDLAALDEALSAIPMDAVLAGPRMAAARDIRMHLLGEVTDAAVLTMPDPLPSHESALKSLAGSPAAHAALHTAVSMMVAARVRGIAQHAVDYAHRSEIIGRLALARRSNDVGALLPSAMLQIGITKTIFGDLLGAEATLRLAYQASAPHVDGFVHRDAAGKLALVYALQGDTARAEVWLRRHDGASATPGRFTPMIDRSALLASALVAIDRLRPDQLAPLLPLIDQETTMERGWRPFHIYVHARRCLIWGDRRGALRMLDDEMPSLAPWLDAYSTMGPLLTATRIDLLLSLGLGDRARSVLESSPHHSALQSAAARLALLTGDDAAGHHAMEDDASQPPGRRSELLLLAAFTRHRRRDMAGALNSLVEALNTTRAARSVVPFAMVPRAELRRVAETVPEVMALLNREPLRGTPGPFGASVALVRLTNRERRVLNRIADGGTLQEIAAELFVSYNTIKTQVRSLYAKLGANSRSAALTTAARHGLLAKPVTDRD